jgi:hypothetical protein
MPKWLLIAFAVVATALTRLVPAEYRLLNMTAVGALALFVGARFGVLRSIAVATAAMLLSDAIQFWDHNGDLMYLPFAPSYLGTIAYSLLGAALIRTSENPARIGGTAILGSVLFYLTTNFASWLSPLHGYERSFAGLMESYTLALPFLKGTAAGDVVYSAIIFGGYAMAVRWSAKPAAIAVSER